MNSSPSTSEPKIEWELETARQLLRDGRHIKARRHCRNVLARDPDNVQALLLLADGSAASGRASENLDYLKRAMALAPENLDIRVAYAEQLTRQNNFDDAALALEAVLAIDPEHELALTDLAVTMQALGRLQEARKYYEKALALASHDARLNHNYGTLLKQLHDFDGAVDAYRRSILLSPYNEDYRLRLGLALIEKGEFEEAVEHMDVLATQNPNHERCAYYQSYAHMKLGNGTAAAGAADRLLNICGPSSTTYTSIASTYLCAGRPDVTKEACALAFQHSPGNRQALADYAIAHATLDQHDGPTLFDLSSMLAIESVQAPEGYADITEFNQALHDHIRNHPVLDFDRISLSCHHGATSTELFVEPSGPTAPLQAIIRDACRRFRARLGRDAEHPYLAHLPTDTHELTLSGWATILHEQGYQHSHIHAKAWMSGVYYVNLPEVMKDEASGDEGCIEFGRSPYYYPRGSQGGIEVVRPREGQLLLFPSYFLHRTLPFVGRQDRVTIAFDFLAQSVQ